MISKRSFACLGQPSSLVRLFPELVSGLVPVWFLLMLSITQAIIYLLIHLYSFRACKGKTAMDLVTTVEMKELLTSPIIKETEPVTNGMINQQALDSGIYIQRLS